MQFSPKILGPNVEFFGLFLDNTGTELRNIISSCVLFLRVIAKKKIITCLLCVNYVIIWLFDILT